MKLTTWNEIAKARNELAKCNRLATVITIPQRELGAEA